MFCAVGMQWGCGMLKLTRAGVLSGIVTGALVMGMAGTTTMAASKRSAPAECRSMDISAYSAFEKLDVVTAAGKRISFNVEIADSFSERQQGMMCRTRIADHEGMLFQFQDVSPRSFWMHNTLIPLDIIYLAPDGRIVSIRKNARPLDQTPLPSGAAANGVLEVRGGLSDKLGLKAGDRVIHPFFR